MKSKLTDLNAWNETIHQIWIAFFWLITIYINKLWTSWNLSGKIIDWYVSGESTSSILIIYRVMKWTQKVKQSRINIHVVLVNKLLIDVVLFIVELSGIVWRHRRSLDLLEFKFGTHIEVSFSDIGCPDTNWGVIKEAIKKQVTRSTIFIWFRILNRSSLKRL